MNIFDGFEDQSPEEVAERLGIKTETEAEKQMNFRKEQLSNIMEMYPHLLSYEEYANEMNWTANYTIDDLMPGMRYRRDDWQEYGGGRIVKIDKKNNKVKIVSDMNMESYYLEFKQIQNFHALYKKDIGNVSYEWITPTDIKELRPGVIFINEHSRGESKCITKVTEGENNTYHIGLEHEMSINIKKSRLGNNKILSIQYKNRSPEHFANISQEDVDNDKLWGDTFYENLGEITKGTRIRRKGKVGKITYSEDAQLEVEFIDYSTKTYYDDFEIDFETLKSDEVMIETLSKNIMHSELHWSDAKKVVKSIKQLKKGMRLKYEGALDEEDMYHIVDIDNENLIVSIYDHFNDMYEDLNIKDFLEQCMIFKEDLGISLPNFINENQLQDDNIWKGVSEFDDIEAGMRIRILSNNITYKNYIVSHTNNEDENIYLFSSEDQDPKPFAFATFENLMKLYYQDAINHFWKYLSISEEEKQGNMYWSDKYEAKTLLPNVRLRHSKSNDVAKVMSQNKDSITIKRNLGDTASFDINDFPFQVFKADLTGMKNLKKKISQEDLEDDELWEYSWAVDNIKPGTLLASSYKIGGMNIEEDITHRSDTVVYYGQNENGILVMDEDGDLNEIDNERFSDFYYVWKGITKKKKKTPKKSGDNNSKGNSNGFKKIRNGGPVVM